MGSGIRRTDSRPASTSVNQGVSGASETNKTQQTAPAPQTPTGGPAVGGDQYASAKGGAPEPRQSTSLEAPDTLRRSPRREGVDRAETKLPEDTIKAADQKVVDAKSKEVEALVKKGDPASLKKAVDALFHVKEPELAATLQKLKDSGALQKLIGKSSEGNNTNLRHMVHGHGSEESKAILGSAIRESVLGGARELGEAAKKAIEGSDKKP